MAYTRLRYHIVTATKNRKPLLTPKVEELAHAVLCNQAKELGGRISHIGGIEDHVHMISTVPPTIALSDFVGKIKCETTSAVKREFEDLQEFEWQVSFSAFTLNPDDMSDIISYVLNQKARHKAGRIRERLERVA